MKIDINVLKKLEPTFGVVPVTMIQGAQQLMDGGVGVAAEGEVLEILNQAGFTFSFSDHAYHNESKFQDDDQAIYVLSNGVILWVWAKQLARGFHDSSKLAKWLTGDSKYPNGKANSFIEIYSKAIGMSPKAPMDRMSGGEGEEEIPNEPPSGPVPDRSQVAPPMGEADKIIAQAKKKMVGVNRMETDDIIDLYNIAKTKKGEDKEKLMAFIKTLKTLKENYIKKSTLQTLVQEIVKGIVKEGAGSSDDLGNFMKSIGGDPDHKKKRISKFRQDMGFDSGYDHSSEKPSGDRGWVEDMANKLWKDPTDIKGTGRSRWTVNRVENAKSGETVYQLKKVQTIERSRFVVKRDGKWFYLDQKPDHTKKWVELPEQPPQSQSGEEPPVKEQSMTGAVSPVTGPNAFKKKESTEEDAQLDEMTTTSGGGGSSAGTTGYNIPGAFSRKMNGRDHIEVLGYEMTPAGKKEYDRKGDRLLEGKKKDNPICKHCHKALKTAGQISCPHCGKTQGDIRSGEENHAKRFATNEGHLFDPSSWSPEEIDALKFVGTGLGVGVVGSIAKRLTKDIRAQLVQKNKLVKAGKESLEKFQAWFKDILTRPIGETAMGDLGPKFGAAQKAYDAQTPPDNNRTECEKCGKNAVYVKDHGQNGDRWWSTTVCQNCGDTQQHDNF